MSIPSFPYTAPVAAPADPVLREFYPEFVERWLADLRTSWPEIRERNDAEELYRFGHTIKGSFMQFGLRELAGVGVDVMNAANENDWATARYYIDGLTAILDTLHQQLRSSASGTSS